MSGKKIAAPKRAACTSSRAFCYSDATAAPPGVEVVVVVRVFELRWLILFVVPSEVEGPALP
jgi:hypothetical protein